MAGTNSRTARPAAPAGRTHNRIAEHVQETQGDVQVQDLEGEDLAVAAANIIRKREKMRQIKLHARTPEEFEPAKKSEAVVLTTTDDTPDMRFVQNKMKYQPDPSLRTDGKTKDNRFLDNRPDLLKLALARPNGKAGVVFADDDEE